MSNLIKWSLSQIVSDRFGKYSKYIIQERALPDSRDGLKPVQRRILFSMYGLNLFYTSSYKKSARVVGDVIGRFHPHGDTSIYDALVRLSQDWKINIPLVDMHGNNGSIDDDPPAAMRYTESRLTKIATSMLSNIDNNAVDFVPNFDDTEIEPTVLPGIFPNLLVNGAKGIASGFATEMPPHNLNEVINGIIYRIKNSSCSIEKIGNFIKGPDFPTGATIIDENSALFTALERGSGKFSIRSKYAVIANKTSPSIIISEIPYGVIKSKLIKEIDEIRIKSKIYGIKDVRDESNREGIRIVIKLIPNSNIKMILLYIMKKTSFQIYYSYNNVAINDNQPRLMSIMDLIDAYINHQKVNIISYSKHILAKKKKRLEILIGLIKTSEIIDDVIKLIRNNNGTKKNIVESLISNFGFTYIQASAIVELRLHRLSNTNQSIYISEKDVLEKEISILKHRITNSSTLNRFLITQLNRFNKENLFKRKTKIISGILDEYRNKNIDENKLIKNEDVHISVSQLGYLKLLTTKSFNSNKINTYKLRDKDKLIIFTDTNTTKTLILFTNLGRCIQIPIYKIEFSKYASLGVHVNDISSLRINEKIVSSFINNPKYANMLYFMVSKLGKIKKTLVQEVSNKKNKWFNVFNLDENDSMVNVEIALDDNFIIIITNDGFAVKYPCTVLNKTSANSGGVRAIKLKSNYVFTLLCTNNNEEILILWTQGYGQKIIVKDIIPFSKNSYGSSLLSKINSKLFILEIIKGNNPKILGMTNILEIQNFDNVKLTKPKQNIFKTQKTKWSINISKKIQENTQKFETKWKTLEDKIEKLSQLSIEDLLKENIEK